METPLALPRDFKELIGLFLAHEVRFMVVGGYALGVHGHPRYTGDIDLWIDMEEQNADRVVAALHDFFGPLPEIRRENFLSDKHMSQFGIEPMRVDILNSISGVAFANAYPRRVVVDYSGLPIPFISLEDFRNNKAAAKRRKDLADLDELS